MAAVIYAVVADLALQRQRVVRDRQNPLDFMQDDELRQKYRFPRHGILHLCNLLQELQRPTRRSVSLSVSLQILMALR